MRSMAIPTAGLSFSRARKIGIPTVVSIQGGDGHWVGSCCETHRLGMLNVVNHANALLIGCESFAAEVVERLGVPRQRFTIVPGAVDVKRFHPANGFVLGAAQDPVRLLYHGRVDRRKGSLDFLKALALLRAQDVRFAATISGIGPDYDSSRDLAAKPRSGSSVHRLRRLQPGASALPGSRRLRQSDLRRRLQQHYSGSHGPAACPVFLASPSASSTALRDRENGLLVQPGDIPALAQALRQIIEDAPLRRRLAATALEECRRTYSWEAVGRLIMNVYAAVKGQKPDTNFDPVLPHDPNCRFRATPHLL